MFALDYGRLMGDPIHSHIHSHSFASYFSGKLEDFAYPEEAIKAALERLPKVG